MHNPRTDHRRVDDEVRTVVVDVCILTRTKGQVGVVRQFQRVGASVPLDELSIRIAEYLYVVSGVVNANRQSAL